MGLKAFNYHVRSEDRAAVITCMEKVAELSVRVARPRGGWITVFEKLLLPSEDRERIGKTLSSALSAVVLDWSIFDDDITGLRLWDRGEKLMEFDSCPGYFGDAVAPPRWERLAGDPEVLWRHCRPGTTTEAVRAALRRRPPGEDGPGPFRSEPDRALVLAPLLGLKTESVLESFESFEGKEPRLIVGRRDGAVDPRVRELQDSRKLHDEATILRWLAEGLDPNARDERGQPILGWISTVGRPALVQAFITAGADPKNMLALYVARGDAAMVHWLLARGGPADEEGPRGSTPLLLATHMRRSEMVAVLLAGGADPNRRHHFLTSIRPGDTEGLTALMGAAESGDARSVELLLAAGADPRCVDSHGRTALSIARERQHQGVIALLEAAGG